MIGGPSRGKGVIGVGSRLGGSSGRGAGKVRKWETEGVLFFVKNIFIMGLELREAGREGQIFGIIFVMAARKFVGVIFGVGSTIS